MKKLFIILLLASFNAHSQKWTKIAIGNGDTMIVQVIKNGVQRDTTMGMIPNVAAALPNMANYATTASLPNMANYSLSTHLHTGVYQPVGSYALTTDNLTGATALASGTQTITINKALYTVTPAAAMSINASGGTAGNRFTILITTSGTTSRVITFGTGFRSVGTLATGTVTAKIFSVSFINIDGVTNVETGRTIGQ